jgi:hypothetical protein
VALIRRRRRKLLIPGPVLVGFSALFDQAHGDPRTPRPYVKVTPTAIGGMLVPFPCPHCGAVRSAVIDPKTRLGYHDKERDFSWCPACRKRYVINPKGAALVGALPPGATHAPALVERAGISEVIGLIENNALDELGTRR